MELKHGIETCTKVVVCKNPPHPRVTTEKPVSIKRFASQFFEGPLSTGWMERGDDHSLAGQGGDEGKATDGGCLS